MPLRDIIDIVFEAPQAISFEAAGSPPASDCGFAAFAGYLTVDPAITWVKLGAMAEGAGLASAELW